MLHYLINKNKRHIFQQLFCLFQAYILKNVHYIRTFLQLHVYIIQNNVREGFNFIIITQKFSRVYVYFILNDNFYW